MRITVCIILLFCWSHGNGQYPYVKKLNYPEQLSTQVVYDMLTDSKGYLWLGTDKGLYRFNGRTFVSIPFNTTASKAVSYLQEDKDGVVWCMNFYNQVFYSQKDTLRQYVIDEAITHDASTFNNLVIGTEKLWLHSFSTIYEFDKASHKLLRKAEGPGKYDRIIAGAVSNNIFYAFSNAGYLFSNSIRKYGWDSIQQSYLDLKFIANNESLIGLGVGLERAPPFQIRNEKSVLLKPVDIPNDVYIFKGVEVNNHDYWLCTQNGAYQWNTETGETKLYLPNERVSDVVKDYQGNYWISTLDNGVFICSSLANTLIKIYDNPLLDNFTKLQALPNGEILAGNSQGLMTKLNLDDRQVFQYDLVKMRETEFISYDTCNQQIFTNRGVFKQDQKQPVELIDYSKGVARDKFGNLIVSYFNGAYVINDHYNQNDRKPILNCPLYIADSANNIDINYGFHNALSLRKKRSITALASIDKESFWVAYEDGLYAYNYNGTIKILKDSEGFAVSAKSLLQLADGSLVVGASTKGVMIFQKGQIVKTYDEKNGLSNNNVRKIIQQDNYIWVLTDAGLDRINETNGVITNYLDEYGLSNIIINDFIVQKDKLLFATPTGILLRYNVPRYSNFEIKFPMLRATSNGEEVAINSILPGGRHDISFYFEALHYISPSSVTYLYRLKGIDTIWRPVGNFNNQLIFNQLSPGKYEFEIQAISGLLYKSRIRNFSFVVPKSFWQKNGFIVLVFLAISLLTWFILRQWKRNLLRKQTVKEQLLKSQLVALRAQMNPHFLYNVLNTVQGLVYGNRKTEAGALLGNFSDLMRKTLHASDKQLLTVKDEIENIRLYLELEKARFDEGFEYHIGVINIEDLAAVYIPSLLIQPFIENAVKHGLMHKRGTKRVDIKFEQKADALGVTIEDNGIGRQQSMEINQRTKSKPSSFATEALNERMDLFNRLYKRKITYQIVDKKDERNNPTGTKIVLIIPDYSNDSRSL